MVLPQMCLGLYPSNAWPDVYLLIPTRSFAPCSSAIYRKKVPHLERAQGAQPPILIAKPQEYRMSYSAC